MNNINEEGFKQTLKALVDNDPGKLSFYDDLGPNGAVPPFAPAEETIKLKRRDTARRKKFNAGMIASGAACLAFAILTATSYVPDSVSPLIYSDNNKTLRVAVADISQPIQEAAAESAPLPLFLIPAIACAAAFAVLLLLKRKTSQ